jgi:membrane protease YdiL (CAAX protease family)
MNESRWGAEIAFTLALTITVTVIIVHGIFGLGIIRSPWQIEINSTYTKYMIVVPIIEILIIVETLLFARNKGLSLEDLGWKKTKFQTITKVLPYLMALYLVTLIVTFALTTIFGPDPTSETFTVDATPRSIPQLLAYLVIYMTLVGPAEALAFRGFIQKGLNNVYGSSVSLVIASVLFGLPHIINYPYNAVTATGTGLVLGYVWQKTDQNTFATAVLHGAFNSIGVILVYLGRIN